MCRLFSVSLSCCLLALFSILTDVVSAGEAGSTPAITLDVSVSHVEQTLKDTEGRYSELMVSPAVEWGQGWQWLADLAWRDADNEVLIPRAKPRLRKLCAWAAAHPHRVQALLAQGKITAAQLDICNHLDGGIETTSAQGAEDITLWLNRFVLLSDTWALLPQIGYKHDNGDAPSGLGSGTRDALAELGVSVDGSPFLFSAVMGFDKVLRQTETTELDDYSYATGSLAYAFNPQWSIAVGAHYETSQSSPYADMKRVDAQCVWQFLDNYSATLQVSRYNKDSGYPDLETGLTVMASF